MQIDLVSQGGSGLRSIAATLKFHVRQQTYDRLDVAVAYATDPGLRALSNILEGWPTASRWVIGLDDAITQPEALDRIQGIPGASLRVAAMAPARRFHPKFYHLWDSGTANRSLILIGSANMTERGLQHNAESAVVLTNETLREVTEAHERFGELWDVGFPPTRDDLSTYRESHRLANVARIAIEKAAVAPPPPNHAANVSVDIPVGRTSENVLAEAVVRIASAKPDGFCSYAEARRIIPQMIALTSDDLAMSPSQGVPKWYQRLRNIQSNSDGLERSTNFIKNGYLEHVPGRNGGYMVTDKGRALLRGH